MPPAEQTRKHTYQWGKKKYISGKLPWSLEALASISYSTAEMGVFIFIIGRFNVIDIRLNYIVDKDNVLVDFTLEMDEFDSYSNEYGDIEDEVDTVMYYYINYW
eukprot:493309_1